jgi:hypothetical protein
MDREVLKLVSVMVIFVLLVSPASASAIASIGMQGISFLSPELGEAINLAMCVTSVVSCVQGKIVGQVYGEALNTLAEISPEAAKVVTTYNQIQGYIDTGAEIVNELQVDETGVIIEGELSFEGVEANIGEELGFEESEDVYVKNLDVEFNQEEGYNKLTFGDGANLMIKQGEYLTFFNNVQAQTDGTAAYIKLDQEGNILESDLTASKDTSFVLNEKRIVVNEGNRVFYKEGKIQIEANEGDVIGLGNEDDFSSSKSDQIKLIDGQIEIEGDVIRGSNFQIDEVVVKGISEGNLGEVSLVNEGYLLGENTIGEWKGLSLTSGESLLLTNSQQDLGTYDNWIYLGGNKLIAEGDGFEILFAENNPYAKIDSSDNFKIVALNDFSMKMENRDSIGKIPRVTVEGDFNIDEDNKGIYSDGGKIFVNRDFALFSDDVEDSTTSPIELVIKNPDGNLRQEKYLVNNFKGIATVPLGAEEGFSHVRYANSIYQIRARTDNRYNYPEISDFESITGKQVDFLGDNLNQPEYVRALIDIYESNPDASFGGVTTIKILGEEEYLAKHGPGTSGLYIDSEKTFYVKSSNDFNEDYGTIIHEAGHAIHYDIRSGKIKREGSGITEVVDYAKLKEMNDEIKVTEGVLSIYGDIDTLPESVKERYLEASERLNRLKNQKKELESKILPIDSEWKDTLNLGYGDLNFLERDGVLRYGHGGLGMAWNSQNGGIQRAREYLNSKKLLSTARSMPHGGFVRAYGASNLKEDIATYREKVISDPGFFKRYGLLEPSEGNIMYDPRYRQKINLLHKYDFITDQEIDAVFHPEKYGL